MTRALFGWRVAAVGLALLAAAAAPAPSAGEPPAPERAHFVDALPRGPTVEERLEEIRRRLQAALVYPPIARREGLTGVAWVQFEIDTAGAAHDIQVARSSGHPILDRAAQRTVDRAGRLPWIDGRIEVPIRFSLGPS